MAEENLGSLRVKVEADFKKFKTDLDNLKQEAEKKAQTIQDAFNRRKIAFDNKFAKMRISELSGEYKRLQAEFQKKITLNVSTSSLKATKDELNQVKSALDDISPAQKKSLTGWALGITAVNQAYQFLTSTFTDLKNIIGGAVRASTQLEVLRANFQGSAEDLELFKTATADTVTEANLIKLSNQATDLGVSLKDQALLFSIAEDAADKYGTSVEEGMMKVIMASEGNIRGLKSLGIQKEIYEKIVNDLARAHGDEMNNLDAEVQKQIRLQAIIQASGVTLESVKNKVKDNADKFQSLTVRVEEAKVKLGELVSKALLPLIDTFDKSGKTGKDFASVVIGVGSAAMGLLPVLIQLRTAQALLGAASLTAASQIDATTASVVAFETAAKGSFLMKLMPMLGAISGAGAAAFVVFSFKELDKPEDSVVKKILDESGFTVPVKLKIGGGKETKGTGFQTFKGPEQVVENTASGYDKVNKTAGEILKKITALNKANEDVNISVEDYKKNLVEIDRLQKLLSVDTETEKNIIDEKIKKLRTENEIKALTTGLSVDIMESAKATLEALLPIVKTDEDRLKILLEIAKASDQIKKINEDIEKKRSKSSPSSPDFEGADKFSEGTKQADEELSRLRIAAIDSEFAQKKALIELEFENLNEHYQELFENRLISETELQEALANNQKAKEKELANLSRQKFDAGLGAARTIANVLTDVFGDNTLVEQFTKVLSIAEAISAVMQAISIFGSIFSGPVGAISAIARAGGGPVERNRVYKVGENGTELFMPRTNGVIIPNSDIPSRMVESNKNYQDRSPDITPRLIAIENAVKVMNLNLVDKDFSVSVHNNAPGVKSTVRKGEKVKTQLARQGAQLNER